MQPYYDIQAIIDNRSYLGRLYGDRLEFPDLSLVVRREEITTQQLAVSGRIQITLQGRSRPIQLNGTPHLARWLDPFLAARRFILAMIFGGSIALVMAIVGTKVWGSGVLFAITNTMLAIIFFRWIYMPYIRVFTTSALAFLIFGISTFYFFPFALVYFVAFFSAFAICFLIARLQKNPRRVVKMYLAIVWMFLCFSNYNSMQIITKFYQDYQIDKTASRVQLSYSDTTKFVHSGDKGWVMPGFWQHNDYQYTDKLTQPLNLLMQVQPIKPQHIFKFEQGKKMVLLSTSEHGLNNTMTVVEENIRVRQDFVWAVYLGKSERFPVSSLRPENGLLGAQVFFDLAHLSNVIIYYLVLPDRKGSWVWTFTKIADEPPYEIINMILDGYEATNPKQSSTK